MCYVSNFAQVIGNMLAARGLDRPPADLIEPVNIRIWEAGRHISFADRRLAPASGCDICL